MSDPPALHVVWFKRDLRVHDHAPLTDAIAQAQASGGAVVPLYVAEPSVTSADDFSARHWTFVRESLVHLRASLALRGQPLIVRHGEVVGVLASLRERLGPFVLHAHEETGAEVTYARDRAVHAWCNSTDTPFHETWQTGVVRRLDTRDRWAITWEARMSTDPLAAPTDLPSLAEAGIDLDPGAIPTHADLHLSDEPSALFLRAGEREAWQTLDTFLHKRGEQYFSGLSTPVRAFHECSRISVHLTWGTISMRTVVRATRARRADLDALAPDDRKAWSKSLRAFESRLHWHCHFMQKLEDEPQIEFRSYIPAFDDLRADEWDQTRFEAWRDGQTGYPFVDACMRALAATGYLNFRMRAMITSFAAYDLWLDWRGLHGYLARAWLDYEPGIHLAQLQMQSGTTGINSVRIYNPTKQGYDHDPDGTFIRRWVPELAHLPGALVHEPHAITPIEAASLGFGVGTDYPLPIVNHLDAARTAKERIYALKKQPHIREQADAVMEKHGSRKKPSSRKRPRARKSTS